MRLAILLAITSARLVAQLNTASLTGLIKDPTESVIAAAKVTATQVETNIQRTTETDSAGIYLFPVLPIGSYTITVEARGFQRTTVTLTLETGQKARQDFSLSVG